jgi:hypothetical protein
MVEPRQLNESETPARPRSIETYVTGVREGGQHLCNFNDEGIVVSTLGRSGQMLICTLVL